ncbi:MAG: hypothetical protein K2P51_03125 [Rhabdochlamydiaceae bacterium]|nr:hypothetical protein [Rhabdochlamydiaceae bacterium]
MRTLNTLIVILLATTSLHALNNDTLLQIAEKIWKNECNGTIEGLVSWNAGEEFASVGIGHFIWYPKDKRGPFKETFPALLLFFEEHHVVLPTWLKSGSFCLWNSREEFLTKKNAAEMQELRQLLKNTIHLQAKFILKRFESAVSELTQGLYSPEKTHIEAQLKRLQASDNGTYALIDYLNFKGEGTDPTERYQGHGWGLIQVLELMPGTSADPIKEFISAAKEVLARRVKSAPKERNEQRWLAGWFHRLETYQLSFY